MSDARALLRAARAGSRVTHQYARYTDIGKLQCSLCDILIKSDKAWTTHLRSPDHAKRALRAAEQAKLSSGARKRKASTDEEDAVEVDGHKRLRESTPDAHEPGLDSADAEQIIVEGAEDTQPKGQGEQVPAMQEEDDDPEWLELQRMIRAPDPPADMAKAAAAGATISAKPMTAEEIAAQAREEQSQQKERRAEELEGEKEDAELAMLDEFEEMDSLQQRVAKLKEMRERLRHGGAASSTAETEEAKPDPLPDAVTGGTVEVPADKNTKNGAVDDDEDEDEGEDEDEDDIWRFGGSA